MRDQESRALPSPCSRADRSPGTPSPAPPRPGPTSGKSPEYISGKRILDEGQIKSIIKESGTAVKTNTIETEVIKKQHGPTYAHEWKDN